MTQDTRTIAFSPGGIELVLQHGDHPVLVGSLALPGDESAVAPHRLVELFTNGNRRSRVTAALVGSVVGERLRYVSHEEADGTLAVTQTDPVDGLLVTTTIRAAGASLQLSTTVRNDGERSVALLVLSSLALLVPAKSGHRLLSGRSEWLGEGRYTEQPVTGLLPDLDLPLYHQDSRGRHAVTGTGSWSTAGALPTGALLDDEGVSIAWQVESTAGWMWELSQAELGTVIVATGPTEADHGFVTRIAPGESFTGVSAGVSLARGGRDAVIAELTRYRRSLLPPRAGLPVIYNDYMNTLMGQPSTEALAPLIAGAAAAGAEYFCIDAGWFTDDRDHWAGIGMWEEAPTRFTDGLRPVINAIRASGMVPGLWLEPEAVGVRSPLIDLLPDEAFFQRAGSVLVEQDRRLLDLRHPAARAHLDAVVDRLVADYGVGYLKLDYNVDAGSGTDVDADSAAAGLLAHTRALYDWLDGIQQRHAGLLIENCASGAMRMDYGVLPHAHIQSTSDQQNGVLYAVIAASAPLSILPEQAGNWAYPAAEMTDGELATTLVSGVMGRMMLSGFLDRLSDAQRAATHEAVALHKRWRERIADGVPVWPLGLPTQGAAANALGFRDGDETLLAVWTTEAGRIPLPDSARIVFDPSGAFAVQGTILTAPAGPAACILTIGDAR
jgi:alpha-galactosidase